MKSIRRCRACESASLVSVLDLGEQPLADGLLPAAAAALDAPRYPLVLAMCADCGLVQLRHTVPREVLFGADYPYFSAYSQSWLAHAREQAARHLRERGLDHDSRVVEIASNDGYLLQNVARRGIPCLGVDPAPGPAAAARRRGVDTLEAFFDAEVARQLADEGWCADLLVANNVLAHAADLHGLVDGIRILLRPDGLAVFEFAYLGDLLEHNAFDTIYHEHLCVFSLSAACRLFERHRLTVTGVERLATHGGSLRLFVEHAGAAVDPGVDALRRAERQRGLDDPASLDGLAARVADHCRALRDALARRVRDGRRIVGYGAAAKGTMLLNVAGIGSGLIDGVVDLNPHKQGRLLPGVGLPIGDPRELRQRPPDDLLILPWNLKSEIMAQQAWLSRAGGCFIVPLPRLEVLR